MKHGINYFLLMQGMYPLYNSLFHLITFTSCFSFFFELIIVFSTHFTSNEQLQTAHEKYFNRIKLNNYRHINERHPFILQLPNNCGVKCHTRLNKIVGQDQHRIISSNYAQLYLEEQTLSNLKNLYSDMILDYVPMLPSFKIEKLTNNFITNCQSPEQFITLLVTFGPLTNSNIDYLSSLFKNFPLSVKYKLNELQLNQETHLTIELDCENAKKITSIISSLPYTLWIERRMEFKTYSRWARGLCQSGDDAKKPLYQINITGQGYIIGVSDTGIDMNHCHFFDPNHNTPYNTVNHEHRKVIYYNRYVDGTDDAEGHGTHVASTTAGKSYIDYGDYRSEYCLENLNSLVLITEMHIILN